MKILLNIIYIYIYTIQYVCMLGRVQDFSLFAEKHLIFYTLQMIRYRHAECE